MNGGTFARFAEWPEPGADAVEWEDYDPNRRQFVGTTGLVVLREFHDRLSPAEDGSGPTFLVEVDGFEPTAVAEDRWALFGLEVAVESDLHLAEVAPFGSAHLLVYSGPADRPTSIVLRLRSGSGAAGEE